MAKAYPWNTPELLNTRKRIAGFLSAAFKSGDPSHVSDAIVTAAHAIGMTEVAKATGITRVNLYRALKGKTNSETILRVLATLGVDLGKQRARRPKRTRAKPVKHASSLGLAEPTAPRRDPGRGQ